MNFQNANSSSNLGRNPRKYPLVGILCLFAATGIISVSPRAIAQARAEFASPAGTPSSANPQEPKGAGPQHTVEGASREELLKIIDKQRKVISALEARVKELEQSAKPAEGQEHNKQ